METPETCYRTLGLPPGATFAEVKRAYRALVKVWHPDRFVAEAERQRQALERFYAITSAYKTLRALQPTPAVTPPPAHGWCQRLQACSWAVIGVVCVGLGVLLAGGWLVFALLPRRSVPPLPLAKPPTMLAQSVQQQQGYITLGSTPDEVRAVQGIPTWATHRMWDYEGSRVYFKAGRVTGWEIWPASPLHVQLLPTTTIHPVPDFFTIGSTKDEVLAVQGTPTRVTERLWEYGASRIIFAEHRVTRWEVWPGAPLKARLSPREPET